MAAMRLMFDVWRTIYRAIQANYYMVSDINLRKHGDIETTNADELCFEQCSWKLAPFWASIQSLLCSMWDCFQVCTNSSGDTVAYSRSRGPRCAWNIHIHRWRTTQWHWDSVTEIQELLRATEEHCLRTLPILGPQSECEWTHWSVGNRSAF